MKYENLVNAMNIQLELFPDSQELKLSDVRKADFEKGLEMAEYILKFTEDNKDEEETFRQIFEFISQFEEKDRARLAAICFESQEVYGDEPSIDEFSELIVKWGLKDKFDKIINLFFE